jgi:thiamine-monophosphate kinase
MLYSMRVSEVGEFGLIRLLAAEIGVEYPPAAGANRRSGLLVDLGDDAVVSERRDGALVWTTDTMVAGVHFLPERTDWEATGWKALAVNLSDIAAMGGEPHLALVTLALPEDFCVEDAQALYQGLHAAAKEYGATLGGGDIVRAPVFSVTVALSGWAFAPKLGRPAAMTRSAARKGDVVAVTGTLGDSAGGLQLLLAGDEGASGAVAQLRDAHERPRPQVAAGRAAVRAGVRCAIDISDGLVQDLGHIARASQVRMRIDAARAPLSEALRQTFPERALGLALSGGEDYQLALIGSRAAIDATRTEAGVEITEIGEVVDADSAHIAVIDESGREIPLPSGGWDHFTAS